MLFTGKFSKEDLKKSKRRFYFIGGLMLLLGLISLSMPLIASFAVETIVGMLTIAVAFSRGNAFRAGDGGSGRRRYGFGRNGGRFHIPCPSHGRSHDP